MSLLARPGVGPADRDTGDIGRPHPYYVVRMVYGLVLWYYYVLGSSGGCADQVVVRNFRVVGHPETPSPATQLCMGSG
jgi:hypothetical protein